MIKNMFYMSILLLMIKCTSNNTDNNPRAKYRLNDLMTMVYTEREFYCKNNIQTNFKLDSVFKEQDLYRNAFMQKMKSEKISTDFNRGFLIEDFMLRKNEIGETNAEYNYGALAYFEDSINRSFVYLEISQDKGKTKFLKIELDSTKCKLINAWIN